MAESTTRPLIDKGHLVSPDDSMQKATRIGYQKKIMRFQIILYFFPEIAQDAQVIKILPNGLDGIQNHLLAINIH